ncbi:MAG: gliding motility-associated C-terminal domain-containing protein [Saprospiraceae bacterium]
MLSIRTLCLCFSLLAGMQLFGQEYLLDGKPISTCGGIFLDSGGEDAAYNPSENMVSTICPDGSAGASGTHIRLEFAGVVLGQGDELCFFDDDFVNPARKLSCASDFKIGKPFIIQASAINNTGCITVVFTSDATGEGPGWSAELSCVTQCQNIQSQLAGSTPQVMPVDTGWMDVCPGQRIYFEGRGLYNQNNLVYTQSDQTSTFEWDFGDGAKAVGLQANHIFEKSGGYNVQLTITDQKGCKNINYLNQRVRVSPRPDFKINNTLAPTICAGDTIHLNASLGGTNPSATITVDPVSSSFHPGGIRSDSLALPDGTGASYQTAIKISGFRPGQKLQDINDLKGICVVMEHSWMRDLEVSISCPNGNKTILHDHPGNVGGMIQLGLPIDSDGSNPIPGTGYDYCWTNNANRGTWLNYANNTFGLFGDGTLPSGNYSAFEPLSNLEGCPLNGDWTIEVKDWWAQDNGFIFSWSIEFDDNLYPDLETFVPGFSTGTWVNNKNIISSNGDDISAIPLNAGITSFIYRVEDNYGCVWDSLIQATVLPPTHPDCHSCTDYSSLLSDTTVCNGELVYLNVAPPGGTSSISFENSPNQEIGYDNYPPANPYESTLAISYINPVSLTNPLSQVKSVCMDIDTDFAWDLQVYLKAPNGALMELTTNNGGLGSYKQTCFSPTASQNITTGAAPFTGTFIPEGNWNVLNGSTINGDWALVVSDAAGKNTFGTLNYWTITFENETTFQYSWDNVQFLSCIDCPNPTANPDQTTTFNVLISDNYNCSETSTATLTVFSSLGPDLICAPSGNGMLDLSWNALPGADYYEVNVNGAGWQQVNGTSFQAGPFGSGANPNIEARAFFSQTGCYSDVTVTSCQVLACDLQTTVETNPPTCAGSDNGYAIFHTGNGMAPYLFSLNGGPFLSDSTFSNLPNGNYTGIVMDDTGCRDTVTFSIVGTTGFMVTMEVLNHVTCFGGSDGRARANITGATNPLDIQWNDPLMQATATASQLSQGVYRVTVLDANGCEGIGSVSINQPPLLSLNIRENDIPCKGENSGSITVLTSGGVAPYMFNWNDPAMQTTATASNLAAGNYGVTVTDSNGCQMSIGGSITEPASGMEIDLIQTRESCYRENNGQAMVSATGGAGPNYLYFWENGNNSPTINNLRTEYYSVTVLDGNGCAAVDSILITELDSISINHTSVMPTCFDGADGRVGITFVEGGNPAGVYDFEWDNGETSPILTGLTGGWYYTVTVTDIQGCKGSKSIFVDRPDEIEFDLNEQDVSCFNGSNGSIEVVNVQGEHPIQSYTWDANTGNQTGQIVNNLMAGTYYVTLTDTVGCTKSGSVRIDQPTEIEIAFDVVDNDCFGDNKGSINTTVNGGTPIAGQNPYQLNWSNGMTGLNIQGLITGTYTVSVTDANNCLQSGTTEVESFAPIEGNLVPENVLCNGDRNGRIIIEAEGGRPPFTYSVDGQSFNGSNIVIGLTAGDYTVYVKDANGCLWTDKTFVREPAPFSIDAGPDAIEIQDGQSLQLDAIVENGVGNIQVSWTDPAVNSLSCLDCLNPVANPSNSLRYFIYGVDENGCEAEDMIAVWVRRERNVMVPTGFTPNGDGNNDLLLVHGKDGTLVKSFKVFDRWGEQVFETGDFFVNDSSTGWDGTFRGKELNTGVYVWFIEVIYADGAKDVLRGETTVIR